jgi:probable F420-dependent oxidoreductase
MDRQPQQVRFGIAIPQMHRHVPVNTAELKRFLAGAETLGYESLWVQEQIVGSAASLEPVTLLTYAAALTTRVRLGSAVLLTVLRNPVQLAKSLTSLDQLSGGRLIVGVGLGGRTAIYPAFGLSPDRRVTRYVEGISLLKSLWTQERTTHRGVFWTLDAAPMEPKPVQKPHPPIWVGALQPAAIRRAARLGDGFIGAGSSSIDEFRSQVDMLRGCLVAAGRDPDTFAVAKRVYIAIDADRARAEQRLTEWFGWYYGNAALAARVAIYGSEAECLDGLSRIVAAGARLLILNPVFDELEHLERLPELVRKIALR